MTSRAPSPWRAAVAGVLVGLAVTALVIANDDSASSDVLPTVPRVDTTPVGTVGPPLGDVVTPIGTNVPADFPVDVPVPRADLVGGEANTGGDAKKYQLYFTGNDLDDLIAQAKQTYQEQGFAIAKEYAGDVRGTPSAGFVGSHNGWTVTVSATATGTGAAMSVTVVSQ